MSIEVNDLELENRLSLLKGEKPKHTIKAVQEARRLEVFIQREKQEAHRKKIEELDRIREQENARAWKVIVTISVVFVLSVLVTLAIVFMDSIVGFLVGLVIGNLPIFLTVGMAFLGIGLAKRFIREMAS